MNPSGGLVGHSTSGMPKRKVLVTGMSGLIGGIVKKQLEGKYELVALNRRKVDGVKCYQADMVDLKAILSAFEGIDTVIHLAAASDESSAWQSYLDRNIIGVYNVFEASRINKVKRVIFASSGSTITAYEGSSPYSELVQGQYDKVSGGWTKVTHLSPPRPNSIYGCTKLWGEALGRMYSDSYGISVICIRIGPVNKEDCPLQPRDYSVWCSQRDVGGIIERCLEAPESLAFDIFYATSNNKWGYRDMDHAREVLGFVPQDSADNFR